MVTLVHLSDIHFLARDHNTQFDLHQHIRRAILEDLGSQPHGTYDGLLITGDIAFGGQKEEYSRAKEFLEEVFNRTGLLPSRTYMVPGNHDVDRSYVAPKLPLWSSHEHIRESDDPNEWRDILSTQLLKDPQQTLLAPLRSYNDFAQGFDCASTAKNLAWSRLFPVPLEDGIVIQLHGLNSALISDEADAAGRMLVSDFQTAHFARSPDLINLVLCHHPPEWMMDKFQLGEVLEAFAPVALFGHEHNVRCVPTKTQIQLFAGAVQPGRRDPTHWLPTYHVIKLSISSSPSGRELVVQVRTREFNKSKGYKFGPRLNAEEQVEDEHRVRLPGPRSAARAHQKEFAQADRPQLASLENMSEVKPALPSQHDVAQRELLVHFFRLGTPLRFAAANDAELLRDGDDSMDPRVMWEAVFRRAVDEKRLAAFWKAVAAHSPALSTQPNPFV